MSAALSIDIKIFVSLQGALLPSIAFARQKLAIDDFWSYGAVG